MPSLSPGGFVFAEVTLFKIGSHELLVVLGGLLDEFVVEPVYFFHFLRGNGQLSGLPPVAG